MHTQLSDLLTTIAAERPDGPLFTILAADGAARTISAARLHGDAICVAATLQAEGVRRGEMLPLVFDHGYELLAAFWGAIYLGAVPTVLPYASPESRSDAHLRHIERLAGFTRASAIVTAPDLVGYLDERVDVGSYRVLALPAAAVGGNAPPAEGFPTDRPNEPPYIQFSSGTTSAPKGVILSHAALLRYCEASRVDFAMTAADVTVGWLPLYHDMGLLTQVLEPLSCARHSVLMSPTVWLREPHQLFQAVDAFRGSITWMPNFAFRYCARRVRDEQIAGLDLSSWRIVGNASEPVLPGDLDAFAARFGPLGFKRTALTISYGLAEHVAGVTWTAPDREPGVDWVRLDGLERGHAVPTEPHAQEGRPMVSCGAPLRGAEVGIVDRDGRPLAERRVGEIVVRSAMTFKGYYGNPTDSAVALRDGWLHTGDLGYLAGGELFVCGRSKDLIIVGGRNIHPSHLETIAAAVQGEDGRFAAAFGVPNPRLGTETPVVVCEMRREPDDAARHRLQQEVRQRIHDTLRVFVGDVHVVGQGWVVRTTSGKINRAANRDKYLSERPPSASEAGGDHVGAESPSERRLIAIWQTLFDRTVVPQDDFFALGGDSLLAAQLAVEIEEHFQRRLPATALLDAPTVAALARLLDSEEGLAEPTLVPIQPAAAPGDRPIFFCVHGLGGGVLDYRPLAQALGSAQPFYALQARGLDGARPVDHCIEAMAAHYVETIRTVQPAGPYYLGGYCFGGVVAYEMARQLRAADQPVALVAILEGYAPAASAPRRGVLGEWRFAIDFVRTLPYWLRDYLHLGRLDMRARNRRLVRVAGKRMLRLLGRRVELEPDDFLDGLSSRPAHLRALLESHLSAARRYAPAPYSGQVVLFRSPRRLLRAPEPDMGWNRLCGEPVDVQLVGGSHATILQEPYARQLAERLRPFLAPN